MATKRTKVPAAHTLSKVYKITPQLVPLAVDVATLVDDPKNVRIHDAAGVRAIANSLDEFGQRKPIVVRKRGLVVEAGNGTLEAAKLLGWTHIAAVLVNDDKKTAARYAVADNRTGDLSEFDDRALADLLTELSSADAMAGLGFEANDLDDLLKSLEGPNDDRIEYTDRIKIPVYEPKGERPAVKELTEATKTEELIGQINAAELPTEVADFLIAAAHRHRRFNYRKIAEFYAHADVELQDLMERSALVIIDYDKAIENGFVRMTNKIATVAPVSTEVG